MGTTLISSVPSVSARFFIQAPITAGGQRNPGDIADFPVNMGQTLSILRPAIAPGFSGMTTYYCGDATAIGLSRQRRHVVTGQNFVWRQLERDEQRCPDDAQNAVPIRARAHHERGERAYLAGDDANGQIEERSSRRASLTNVGTTHHHDDLIDSDKMAAAITSQDGSTDLNVTLAVLPALLSASRHEHVCRHDNVSAET